MPQLFCKWIKSKLVEANASQSALLSFDMTDKRAMSLVLFKTTYKLLYYLLDIVKKAIK